jgi:ADP-ribosylglycohydrolase
MLFFNLQSINFTVLFFSLFLFSQSGLNSVYHYVEDFLESLNLDASSLYSRNKELGGFLAGIAGDNIGMPYEFRFIKNREDLVIPYMLPNKFVHDPETDDGKYAQVCGAGIFSDDTSMGLCFGKAIVDYKIHLNKNRVANYFCRWLESSVEDNFYSALSFDGCIFSDCGVTIRSVLNRYRESGRLYPEENRMTNGCLMRNYPCIIGSKTLEEAIYLSRLQTSVTHANPSILNMSSLLTSVCWNLLQHDISASKDIIVDTIINDQSGDPLIERYVKPMILFFQKIGFDNLESLRLVEKTDSLAFEIFW